MIAAVTLTIAGSAPTVGAVKHGQGSTGSLVPVEARLSFRAGVPRRVTQLRHTISDRRQATQRHRRWLQLVPMRTEYRERSSRSVPYLKYLRGKWAKRAHRHWKLTLITLRDFEVYPDSHAWQKAVEEAQRPYPGTRDWLLSCSASEGGWGRWVPNSQGSGVGGWLQFYPSTFARMFGTASFDVARRGFIVPGSAHSWYSPLGQALAGAWGVTNGRRHEWHGSGCR